MDRYSYIGNAESGYIESLYEDFRRDPQSIDENWKKFFEGFEFASARWNGDASPGISPREFRVVELITAYRNKGHLLSTTNPIRPRLDRKPHLELGDFGLDEGDLDTVFLAAEVFGMEPAPLRDIIAQLQRAYTRDLGVEYNYILNPEEREWFRLQIEEVAPTLDLPIEKKKRILQKLNETVVFEQFLNKKYIGQKRFSLEGGESTIPALDAILTEGSESGVEEVVIGMAHRGRLNVLANIMGKTYEQIFSEFEGIADPDLTMGDGDVKYHLGFSSLVETFTGKKINLKLAPNPSHLEAVGPVVEGYVRAKADLLYKEDKRKILPILLHGDAAVAGQGVVYEVSQMSQLAGYSTGGTIHFVINNQIGFTTDFDDARSSHYCTSVARITHAPVLHVNGDNVEAVVFAVELATAYRQKFSKDIWIDMVCYRKHGHNEGDDPKYTQPFLYDLIAKHPNPREIYVAQLQASGKLEREMADKTEKEFWGNLQERLDMVKQKPLPYEYQPPEQDWRKLQKKATSIDFDKSPRTAVTKASVRRVFEALHEVPEGFSAQRKISKLLGSSRGMFEGGTVDWALAELLAYGSLLDEGHDIRMSGQDCKRGTFSHRHAILADGKTNKEYNRLSRISKDQGVFRIYNSLLSEFAVLGFEYGYSLGSPNTLNIWEAQFGDFFNGAQVIVDQFISAAQSKWQRQSGLVLLLPHGYEGQGPEHSSARLERFLQECAEFNMVVANITTPANFFHALRRQLTWKFRRPLVIMSPKSLLRHPECRSSVADLSKGGFLDLLYDDYAHKDGKKVRKVLFCSGKVYYDLLEHQRTTEARDVAIIRLEQLYPLALREIDEVVAKYSNAEKLWVQEEPRNMGAWTYLLNRLRHIDWVLVARKSSASPATGYMMVHNEEQKRIVDRAFA